MKIGASFAQQLGSRRAATAVEDSWRIHSAKEKTLSVTFETSFANDPDAKETFVFVVQDQGLLVQRYHVNSNELLGGAAGTSSDSQSGP